MLTYPLYSYSLFFSTIVQDAKLKLHETREVMRNGGIKYIFFFIREGPLVKDCLWFLAFLFTYWSHHWPCFFITHPLQNNHRTIILTIYFGDSMTIHFSLMLFLFQIICKFCLIYFIFNSDDPEPLSPSLFLLGVKIVYSVIY